MWAIKNLLMTASNLFAVNSVLHHSHIFGPRLLGYITYRKWRKRNRITIKLAPEFTTSFRDACIDILLHDVKPE